MTPKIDPLDRFAPWPQHEAEATADALIRHAVVHAHGALALADAVPRKAPRQLERALRYIAIATLLAEMHAEPARADSAARHLWARLGDGADLATHLHAWVGVFGIDPDDVARAAVEAYASRRAAELPAAELPAVDRLRRGFEAAVEAHVATGAPMPYLSTADPDALRAVVDDLRQALSDAQADIAGLRQRNAELHRSLTATPTPEPDGGPVIHFADLGPVVHFAAPHICIDDRHLRQLCAWCGHRLVNYDLDRVAVPVGDEGPLPTWPTGALVEVDGGMSVLLGEWTADMRLPANTCHRRETARLDQGDNRG